MRAVLLLVVVAVLALGSWLLLRTDPQLAPSPEVPAPRSTLDAATASTPTPATPTSAPFAREAVKDTAATEQLPIPPDATWVEVLVIDKATREPAPNVEVLWSNPSQQERISALPLEERQALMNAPDLHAERFGWRANTDQHGKVRVTTANDFAMVIARDEHRYGVLRLTTNAPPPEQGHRLELARDYTVTVHVTGVDGADASDVRVGMQPFDPGTDEQPKVFNSEAPRTDEHGLTAFRHVQEQMTWAWGTRKGRPVGALLLSICQPGFAADPVTLDPQNLPTEPVEMQLPADGELVVRVLFEGQPLPHLRSLKLHAGPKHDSDASNGALQERVDEDGRAHFRRVALGKTFFVEGHSWSVQLPGPSMPGQVASQTIDIAEHVFAVSGRLLDENKPLANMTVSLQFEHGTGSGGGWVETDADGRFLWIPRDLWGDGPKLELRELQFVRMPIDEPERRCKVEPRVLHPGRNDLGDLHLVVEPLIVSGRIVFDCKGRHAGVGIERFVPSQNQGQEGRWERVELPWPVVTPDGRFALRGALAPRRYRLVVSTMQSLPVEPIEFAPGTADLEVHVRCGNAVEATCLLAEELDAELLRLELVPTDHAPEPRPTWALMDRFAGKPQRRDAERAQRVRFTWAAVEQGRYTLRISGASAKPVVEIPDVVLPLPDGGDPRLADIDLLTKLQLLHLRIRRADGTTDGHSQPPTAFLMPQADEQHWRGWSMPQNELLLPVPPGPQEVFLSGPRLRPMTLHGVEGVVEVELQEWPRVELTFVGTELLPEGAQLRVYSSQPRPGPSDQRRFSTPWMSGSLSGMLFFNGDSATVENGRAPLRVGDGETNLRVILSIGGHSEGLEHFTPRKVVDAQPTLVQLSTDEVREVVARLQAKAAGK
ncbi:MAG: hypothetical protein R3F29_14840 [Planctomycetota bacterium]